MQTRWEREVQVYLQREAKKHVSFLFFLPLFLFSLFSFCGDNFVVRTLDTPSGGTMVNLLHKSDWICLGDVIDAGGLIRSCGACEPGQGPREGQNSIFPTAMLRNPIDMDGGVDVWDVVYACEYFPLTVLAL